MEIDPKICPICKYKNTDLREMFSWICVNSHLGPDSWCQITTATRNIITTIRIPVHNTGVLLRHFHTTGYTLIYCDKGRNLLFYYPKLVFHDYENLKKTQQKLSTYMLFS